MATTRVEVEREKSRRRLVLDQLIEEAQGTIYAVVAALLLVASGFTLVGTVVDVIEGSDSREIANTGVFMLDRVLLLFIMAELLYTLRLIDFSGRILVEPFLLIALIAVVRRILVITAEFEHSDVTDYLVEIGALAGLAFVLVASIYLLRRSLGPAARPQSQL
jgi:uncharacterized membrane protein (DUF373 family)